MDEMICSLGFVSKQSGQMGKVGEGRDETRLEDGSMGVHSL